MVVDIDGIDGLTYTVIGFDHEGTAETPLEVPVEPFGVDRYRIIVRAPEGESQRQITISVSDKTSGETDTNRASFRGPNE